MFEPFSPLLSVLPILLSLSMTNFLHHFMFDIYGSNLYLIEIRIYTFHDEVINGRKSQGKINKIFRHLVCREF